MGLGPPKLASFRPIDRIEFADLISMNPVMFSYPRLMLAHEDFPRESDPFSPCLIGNILG